MPGKYDLITFNSVTSSPADRKYSFGRQSRFPKLNLQGTDHLCYEATNVMSKRATNMGFGERFKVARYAKELRPSPDSYAIPSLFNPEQSISNYSRFSRFQKG